MALDYGEDFNLWYVLRPIFQDSTPTKKKFEHEIAIIRATNKGQQNWRMNWRNSKQIKKRNPIITQKETENRDNHYLYQQCRSSPVRDDRGGGSPRNAAEERERERERESWRESLGLDRWFRTEQCQYLNKKRTVLQETVRTENFTRTSTLPSVWYCGAISLVHGLDTWGGCLDVLWKKIERRMKKLIWTGHGVFSFGNH